VKLYSFYFHNRCRSIDKRWIFNIKEKRSVKERGMMNANVKVSYSLICKDLNEAIDAKNKIIANTVDGETVEIKIEGMREVWTVKALRDILSEIP